MNRSQPGPGIPEMLAVHGVTDSALSELTPEELKALGHALRFVPDNAFVGRDFLWQSEGFKSLWEKVAHAINTRDDMAAYRKTPEVGAPNLMVEPESRGPE